MPITSIRLQAELEEPLMLMAKKFQRSKNWMINQAIKEFVELNSTKTTSYHSPESIPLSINEEDGKNSIIAKDKIQQLLHQLPEKFSIEELQYHLYVSSKINQGIQQAENEGTKTQQEVEKVFAKWTTL